MAYDEGLAERVRALLEDTPKLTEKRMFGGLVFLVDEKMTVGVGKDRLLVRVGKEHQARALKRPHVTPMRMGEQASNGFVYVAMDGVDREDDLERWVKEGLAYARSLPAKKPAAKTKKKVRR
jgi:TfoX/Sxy family transcriptional regulator of competence genes